MTARRFQRALDAVAWPGARSATARPALRGDTAWMRDPGIQGYSLGRRVRAGRRRRELVLTVYVARKVDAPAVPVPRTIEIDGIDAPVPTDVVAIGVLERQRFEVRARPTQPGDGLSHPACGNGTFGCLVRKRGQPQALYVLSNAHVIANDGQAKPEDPIHQPSVRGVGVGPTGDVIALFAESVPFDFSEDLNLNRVDAAIALVTDREQVRAAIRDIGLPVGVSSRIREGMRVQKTGSKTGHRWGIVRDIDFRAAYPYFDGRDMRRAGFHDLVLCDPDDDPAGERPFSERGDSGALVLNEAREAVGLLMAGNAGASVFCRIDHVVRALGLELVTTEALAARDLPGPGGHRARGDRRRNPGGTRSP